MWNFLLQNPLLAQINFRYEKMTKYQNSMQVQNKTIRKKIGDLASFYNFISNNQ